MTIYGPDLSHWNGGMHVDRDTVFVIAKATQARSIFDPTYGTWRTQSAQVGAVFAAYHWLNHGNVAAQARWCHDHVGAVPLMIDAEDVAGNTGYAGALTVADITGFTQAYRALGGVVGLVYLPRWYWQGHMGGPSLTPLLDARLGLVSSNYTRYSDTGPGWTPYGGVAPAVWQYTDRLPYGGGTSDFNAYRGTIDQFRVLLNGGGGVSGPATGGGGSDVGVFDTEPGKSLIFTSLDAAAGGPMHVRDALLKQAVDALDRRFDDLTTRLDALVTAGGNPDIAPVLVALREVAAQMTAEYGDVKSELTALRQAALNAARAEVGALDDDPTT